MIILNFTRGITPTQLARIEALINKKISQIIDHPIEFSHSKAFDNQAREAIDNIGWSSQHWNNLTFMVNLPGLAPGAAALLAEIHGRCGYFPPVVRMRDTGVVGPERFEVAEVINLAVMRESSRLWSKQQASPAE